MRFDRSWERFKGGQMRVGANVMRVTISRKGVIYLNLRAYELLNKPAAVEMFYSREHDAIGLVKGDPRQADNFLVTKKQMGWAVHTASFCRHHRIKIKDTERFVSPVIDSSNRLLLCLRETVNVGGIAQKRKMED